jgi:hypothetical protein
MALPRPRGRARASCFPSCVSRGGTFEFREGVIYLAASGRTPQPLGQCLTYELVRSFLSQDPTRIMPKKRRANGRNKPAGARGHGTHPTTTSTVLPREKASPNTPNAPGKRRNDRLPRAFALGEGGIRSPGSPATPRRRAVLDLRTAVLDTAAVDESRMFPLSPIWWY